ncbi:cytochrome P450 2U1-like isoform X1 [Ciona intestinalis]
MLFQIMSDVSACLSIVFFTAFLALCYWYKRPSNFPPGPRGVPFLGVIPFLGNYPARVMRKWSRNYGPVMSVRMGSRDLVVLNSHESIQKALVKQSQNFSGRPNLPALTQVTDGLGLATLDYTDDWKTQHRFGLTTLRGFGVGKRSMEDRIVEEVAYLNDAIRSHNGKPFDILGILGNAVSNNTCSVVMGRRFDYDNKRFKKIIALLSGLFTNPKSNSTIILVLFMPFLMKIPPFSRINNKRVDSINEIKRLLREIVHEHELSFDKDDIRDFMDAFIAEQKKNDKHSSFTDLQLLQYVRDLFVAGTETTTSTLRWSILCLIHNPEMQEKLRKEISKVIGQDRVPAMSDKTQMPYTCAFMQEVFRYRTLVPLSLFHVTNDDVSLNGYSIPKGTTVLPNLWAAHNDPDVWDEPSKFKPERHLDEKGNFVQSKHVIPFSVGPRHCLGEQLARMEIFIFLVSMVQKFEFLPDPNEPDLPEIENGSCGTVFVPFRFKQIAKMI